ncbi:MTAP family purine nucleoside phosphorylase [Candidatus Uhrbacteria bacterium]|nr:MTAP family purine nucleoside phosphorylase [Candidatus Uhrbacteria bacterium]
MRPPFIGIIGGSGMEDKEIFHSNTKTHRIETPYGNPSDVVLTGKIGGIKAAFLPRHGTKHQLAPSKIPYKANIWALRSLGVQFIIGTCIVGSLKKKIEPGSFVVLDQFVNLTHGRDHECIEKDGSFLHLPMGEPYCAVTRDLVIQGLKETNRRVQRKGTVVVIQGPRFSTKAESRFFMRQKWDVVNMTQYPECLFARELGVCYAAFASVTDYDVGTEQTMSMDPSDLSKVLKVFHKNTEKTIKALQNMVTGAGKLTCGCAASRIREYYNQSDNKLYAKRRKANEVISRERCRSRCNV